MKKVIYTAIFGDYDHLSDPEKSVGRDMYIPPGFDLVCFTDTDIKSNVWDVRNVLPIYEDSTRNARKYKILPHRFLPEYDLSIWMDGNQHCVGDFNDFIVKYLEDSNLACYDHKQCRLDPRGCVYDEARAILQLGQNDPNNRYKDDPNLVVKQVENYKKEGYPENNGLIVSGVMLRKHNELDVVEAMELWWEELKYNSKRDQLSFDYSVWKTDLKFNLIDGDIRDDGYTKEVRHKKR